VTTIELKDIGPITRISLPLPDGGGVCVLRGENGAGKTTAINALLTLCGSKGTLHPRDEAPSGSVEGLGAKVSVGARTRRTGELGVATLEGKLSIGDLVDPGLLDPVAADARRIKALLALTGAKADLSLFKGILGDDGPPLAEVLGLEAMSADDLLTMAATVKRDLEAAGRQKEARASQHKAEAAGLKAAVQGLPEAGAVDEAALLAEMQAASADQARLLSAAEAANRAAEDRDAAEQALDNAEENYKGPPLDETQKAADDAAEELGGAEEEMERLKEQLRKAEELVANRNTEYKLRDAALEAARQHERDIAHWRKSLTDAAALESPSPEDLTIAQDRVTRATDALGTAAAGRQAAEKRRRAAEEEAKAEVFAREATRFRDGAKAVDNVLSNAVACPELRVQAGRLVMDTTRGVTPLAELSTGERWAIALSIAARTVGPGGLIPVSQEAWQALQPANKAKVAALAQQLEVWIVTAEVTDGPLKAEVV